MSQNVILAPIGKELIETLTIPDLKKEYRVSWDVFECLQPLVNGNHKNEFSGSFHDKNKNKKCCTEEYICLPHANVERGKGDSAKFYENIPFTYHTHPKYYYTEYGVNIAPPSGEDIGVFLRGCIESKTCVHIVLSLEGLYIMYANPCFIKQARRLYKRAKKNNNIHARSIYNVALIGAEILGMVTHEFRTTWNVDQWLHWVRSRFVCRNVPAQEYSQEIREKFKYHCEECSDEYIQNFQQLFHEIVRTSFELAGCSAENTIQNTRWSEGNWIDVDFITWEQAKKQGYVTIKCC